MNIAIIGTYPPRACGIGTFTQNLRKAVTGQYQGNPNTLNAHVIAMTTERDEDYPEEVTFRIREDCLEDYLSAASYINRSSIDLVVLQHEYGIFGGQEGTYILTLLEKLKKPLVVTFHTILKEPSSMQHYILQQISARAGKVVVMTRLARNFLQDIYQVPAAKISIIEHGVPSIHTDRREVIRKRLGMDGNRILFTFGFLGRGKGIETAIMALPKIIDAFPDTRYVILGKTHPVTVEHCGEEYREYLQGLACKMGVSRNVIFINAFASESELWEYLKACDIYITPYPNEAQITSGTLSYAMGAGAAIVSTPYWHARDLLQDGKGQLFDFRDSEQLAAIVCDLFAHPEKLRDIREKAGRYGESLKWPLIGQQYRHLFRKVVTTAGFSIGRLKEDQAIPGISFRHLQTLTDDTGILQHAKYIFPNRFEGYCLDDNARALIVALAAIRLHPSKWLAGAAMTYMSYLHYSQRGDGLFRNFMGYNREFLEETGSEDSFGRAIWALGFAMNHAPDPAFSEMAGAMFWKAVPHFQHLKAIRSIAFTMAGICFYLRQDSSNEFLLNLLHTLREKLREAYENNREPGWDWFEKELTYSNAILPWVLYFSLEHLPNDRVAQIARATTCFLETITMEEGYFIPIGCEEFYRKDGPRSLFDQQPVDVMAMVLLYLQAAKVTGKNAYFEKARTCYRWFHGENILRLPLYDPKTGGCKDGLEKMGVNQNQGAESTLSFLLSHLSLEEAERDYIQRKGRQRNGHVNRDPDRERLLTT